jgi:hypothetical protein
MAATLLSFLFCSLVPRFISLAFFLNRQGEIQYIHKHTFSQIIPKIHSLLRRLRLLRLLRRRQRLLQLPALRQVGPF